jgi:HK97 family phage portal protein
MANIFKKFFGKTSTDQTLTNLFNEAFFSFLGGSYAKYDLNNLNYMNKGYNINPDVYSVISQISRKFASVPCYLKTVEDKESYKSFLNIKSLNPADIARKRIFETKAFEQKEIKEPLESPNYYQTESEYKELWETFMLITGNAYQYILSPEDGPNAGVPMARFLLPAHMMQIVLKKDAAFNNLESPIDHYILVYGNAFVEFPAKDIIHTKFPNPNYDEQGSHLYGQSPLAAALLDIQTGNITRDDNNKSMNSGGMYGFIHAKDGQTSLTPAQAEELKSRLIEMRLDTQALGRIRGASAPLGFTKISVDTKDKMPFEYIKNSQKTVCNVLGWSDKLLNNDEGAKYDNMDAAWKMAISNRIIPDLKIYEDALNKYYYPRFKNLGNVKMFFDVSEMPEMQNDMKAMVDWLSVAMENGAITPEEFRIALRYPETGKPEMMLHYLKGGLTPIEDIMSDQDFNINE